MLVKTMLVGLLLASTPILVATTPQGQGVSSRAGTATAASAGRADEVARLRQQLADQQAREARVKARLERVESQLAECLDLLTEPEPAEPRRNCTPSRSNLRALMTRYQWMEERGFDDHAQRVLARLVDDNGDDVSRLNARAWELMTDADSAGQFDTVALAFVDRMLQREQSLDHRMLDTAALAKFLAGQVDEAVRLERAALQKNHGSDDYRRRLRTYEAAQRTLARSTHVEAAATDAEDAAAPAAATPSLND